MLPVTLYSDGPLAGQWAGARLYPDKVSALIFLHRGSSVHSFVDYSTDMEDPDTPVISIKLLAARIVSMTPLRCSDPGTQHSSRRPGCMARSFGRPSLCGRCYRKRFHRQFTHSTQYPLSLRCLGRQLLSGHREAALGCLSNLRPDLDFSVRTRLLVAPGGS